MVLKIISALAIVAVLALIVVAWIWRPIAASHTSIVSGNLPDAIPLRDFYANQDSKYGWALSADGKKLTWLEIEWFKPILRIKNLETDVTTSLRPPKGFLGYVWAADQETILFTLDAKGYEYQKIAAIDSSNPASGLRIFDLGETTTAFIYHIPKQKTDEIIIAHNARDPGSFDTYQLNVKTGSTEPFGARLGHQTSYVLDHAGNISGRVVYENPQDGDWSLEVSDKDGTWREIASGDYKDSLIFSDQIGKERSVYALSNRGRDKRALVKFSLEDGSEEVVHSDPDVDISGVLLNPKNNELLMAISHPGYQRRVFFDGDFEDDISKLGLPENTSLHIAAQTYDFSKSLVQIETAEAGFETYLIDREKGTKETISNSGHCKAS